MTEYDIQLLRKPAHRHGLVVGCECSEFIGRLGAVAGNCGSEGRNTINLNGHGVDAGGLFQDHVPGGNLVTVGLRFILVRSCGNLGQQ